MLHYLAVVYGLPSPQFLPPQGNINTWGETRFENYLGLLYLLTYTIGIGQNLSPSIGMSKPHLRSLEANVV
jgi:hypothetical protein